MESLLRGHSSHELQGATPFTAGGKLAKARLYRARQYHFLLTYMSSDMIQKTSLLMSFFTDTLKILLYQKPVYVLFYIHLVIQQIYLPILPSSTKPFSDV